MAETQKDRSLSLQSLFLIMGKFLSLPISFFIPIVLVRHFDVAEFGNYKQLFMIFYIFLPFLDFGTSQGLVYYLPKQPSRKKDIISNYIYTQIGFCLIGLLAFLLLQNQISIFFTSSKEIAEYIPIIGVFLVLWVLSNNLEIFFTTEKKSVQASLIIFLSDGVKGLAVIWFVLMGARLEAVLYVFVGVGAIRLLLMFFYLYRNQSISLFSLDRSLLISQLKYSIPLGFAVAVNSLIDYSHQAIVSNQLSAAEFAIYSIGCFQVPIIGIISIYVSRVAIIRICELHDEHNTKEIGHLISSSFRKLAIVFIPVFLILWTTAPEFIRVLYTKAYLDSIPIFRVFICILPLAVILVEYVPRSLGDSIYVFKVNIVTLIINILLVVVLMQSLGIIGAAAGFVLSRVVRKVIIMRYMVKNLQVPWTTLVPLQVLGRITLISAACLIPGIILTNVINLSPKANLIMEWLLFFTICPIVFWTLKIITTPEKENTRRYLLHLWQKYFTPIYKKIPGINDK